MKDNLTEIIMIVDRSGSMCDLVDDTIGGYNSFIESQKDDPGETRVTAVLFNQYNNTICSNTDIHEVKQLTKNEYIPYGGTALLDALGDTIKSVGKRLFNTSEENRPSKVIVVVITDGEENSSRKYTKQNIVKMIEEQQDVYNWKFMFLGANMDAVSEAASLGMDTTFARSYTANEIGTESVYTSVAAAATSLKSMTNGDWCTQDATCDAYVEAVASLDAIC